MCIQTRFWLSTWNIFRLCSHTVPFLLSPKIVSCLHRSDSISAQETTCFCAHGKHLVSWEIMEDAMVRALGE